MKNFQNFVSLTRDELRNTNGGRVTCVSTCSGDAQCKENNPNGYCGYFECNGGIKRVCVLNDPQNDN